MDHFEEEPPVIKKRKIDFDEGGEKPVKKKKTASSHVTPRKRRLSHCSTPSKYVIDPTTPGTLHKKMKLDLPDEEKEKLFFPNGKMTLQSPGIKSRLSDDYYTRLYMPSASDSKYGHLIHIETHPNGGASVVHCYQDELAHLSPEEMHEFTNEYFDIVYAEEPPGAPKHVMGIVHGSASYLPDLVEYFAVNHPNMVVKTQMLGKPEIETMTMEKYRDTVHSSYRHGTYRNPGPLLQVNNRS
jgi:hypothetical protein